MKKFLIPLIIILSLLLFNEFFKKPVTSIIQEKTLKTELVTCENIKINKESKYAWSVKGMVRNITSFPIKGYVKIKFLNSNNDIVYTTKTSVNDGDSFSTGQAASFEYYTEPENFDGVINFDVEFIEK